MKLISRSLFYVYSKNNETIISVKDYGKGISSTSIKNIFTEYYTSGKRTILA